MKYIFLIFCLSFLMSCTGEKSRDISPRERIVDIISESPLGSHGKGVILSSGKVLTSRHVVSDCIDGGMTGTYISHGCHIVHGGLSSSIQSIDVPDISRDIAYVNSASEEHISLIPEIDISHILLGQEVYVITSGGVLTGKVISLAPTYIGYDRYLSGSLLSGSIVTDIIVEKGESGVPIWTLSGELIGVVSAFDEGGKRSYGVR